MLFIACGLLFDVVVTTNGMRFRGEVVKETDKEVVLQTDEGRMVFQREEVVRVIHEERPSTPPEKPPTPPDEQSTGPEKPPTPPDEQMTPPDEASENRETRTVGPFAVRWRAEETLTVVQDGADVVLKKDGVFEGRIFVQPTGKESRPGEVVEKVVEQEVKSRGGKVTEKRRLPGGLKMTGEVGGRLFWVRMILVDDHALFVVGTGKKEGSERWLAPLERMVASLEIVETPR